MSAIIIICVIWAIAKALNKKPSRKRNKKTHTAVAFCKPQTISRAEAARLQKEWERRERRQYEALMAKNDLDRLEVEKNTLIRLLEAIEAELQTADKPQRITTLLTKQSVTERQLHALDRKIEKAYYVANATIY